MSKNPLVNAIAASLYIVLVISILDYGMSNAAPTKSIVAPIVMVSVFTLSAAVMGYLFFYHPAVMYFDGKKDHAVKLFLQTVISFAVITGLLLSLLFSGLVK